MDNAVQGGTNVNVTLTDVSATGGAALVWPTDYDNVVAPLVFAGTAGETQQFTVDTLNDVVLESTETFTVSLDAVNPLVTDTDTATGTITDNALPDITVLKSANPTTLPLAGGTVTYTVQVTNNLATETFILDTLNDDIFGDLTVTTGSIDSTTCTLNQTIAASGSYSCTFDVTLGADTDGSTHVNTVTASGLDPEGNPDSDTDPATVTYDALPDITVLKSANPTTLPLAGGTVTYTVQVTNNLATETFILDTLNDDIFGDLTVTTGSIDSTTCTLNQTIAASGSYSCTFDVTLGADTDGSTHVNTVTASGLDPEGNPDSDTDPATVTYDALPNIAVLKTANPLILPLAGGSVTYTVQVTNNLTKETFILDTLDDDIFNDITTTGHDGISATTCSLPQTIAISGSYSCTFDATLGVGTDGSTHVNTIIASGLDPEGNPGSDTDPATVTYIGLPEISIDDVTQAETDSGTTTFTFTVSIDQIDPGNDTTVNWTTNDGTAFDPSDYSAASGIATITSGTLSTTIDITVNGDTAIEATENFTIDLSGPSANATIADSQGLGTISNDDSDESWWHCDWGSRLRLTFNNIGQTENLTDFPVLVTLSSGIGGNIDYGKTQNNGQDIRFIDGNTGAQLEYEIETWNESGDSLVWVKVPQIDGTSITDFIWLYYNNSGAADAQNAAGVWDANYKGVYHLEEDVNDEDTTGIHDDSTANGNDGTQSGNVEGIGQIANGQDFDGADDYITIGNVIGGANAVTLSAWVKHDTMLAIRERYVEIGNEAVIRHDGVAGVGQLHFYIRTGGVSRALRVDGALTNGVWYHVAGTWDGTTQKIFLDGLEMDSQVPGGSLNPPVNGHINDEDPTETMDGIIDEVRISDTARSPDWIAAQYLSMTDTFITYNAEELSSAYCPSANAGGPYTINEGDSIILNASASSDPNGDPLTFSWDLDNDSVFGDVTGETPTVSWATLVSFGINAAGSYPISVEVDDAIDGTDTAATTITVAPPPDLSWVDCDWGSRIKLGFNNSGQSENLTDFPVLVTLNSGNIDYNKTRDNGEDIRFYDGNTGAALSYEIEAWNESGDSLVWVNVPQIYGSSNSDFIWMYYNNPAASDAQNTAGVWTNNYSGVWHMNEATGAPSLDATSNSNDGISLSGPAQATTGKISGGKNFNVGAAQTSVEIPADASLDLSLYANWTLSAWVKPTSYVGTNYPIVYSYNTRATLGLSQATAGPDGRIESWRNDSTLLNSDSSATFNNWNHIVVVRDPATTYFYLNGSPDGSGASEPITGGGGVTWIGAEAIYNDADFFGIIDEVRVSTTNRSADWIAAQHLSMTDTFITYNAEEASSGFCPSADAGGPYSINVGDPVGLDASASSDPNSDPLTFSWDLNNDGTYGDVTGETPTVSWATLESFGINSAGNYPISVEADDGIDGTDTATTTIFVNPVPDTSWCNCDWGSRIQLVFDNSGQTEGLIDFPVLITLNSGIIDYGKTQDNGEDIRFYDGNTGAELNYEIEEWDEGGDSSVWVKVPQINSASNTDFIWMYYDNPAASDAQNAAGVWNTNYVGVWHLGESGSGVADEYLDSSGYGNHGQGGSGDGTKTPAQTTSGRIGNAQDFDGANSPEDYIDLGNSATLAPSSITVSAWAKSEGSGDIQTWQDIVGSQDFNNGGYLLDLTPEATGVQWRTHSSGTHDDVAANVTTSEWHLYTGTFTGSTLRLYVDGILQNTDSSAAMDASSRGVAIGDDSVFGGNGEFDGLIDEVRISKTARSSNWIAAQHLSMTNAFITYNAEELSSGTCPAADAGGPYTITEGDSVDLDASASSDPNSDPLTFSWDLDNDGTYGDVTGETPTVSWGTLVSLGINTAGTYPISVEVDDGTGLTDTAATTIVVDPLPDTSWCACDWGSRIKLTFDNSGQTEDLIDFPVLVRLGIADLDYTKTQNNGEDIRFFDGATGAALSYEIEKWNKLGESLVWVKVPFINGGSSTDYIWMHYDNPAALDAQDPAGVWDTNYDGVWHLAEDVIDEGTTGTHISSTGANNGAQNGNVEGGGVIADGQDFDGNDLGTGDYIGVGTSPGSATDLTVEFWMNADVNNKWMRALGKFEADHAGDQGWSFLTGKSGESGYEGAVIFRIGDNTDYGGSEVMAETLFEINTWVHIVGTYS